MSNIDKQALRKRYSAKPTPKCDICGARMTIQRMSGSRVTYGCSGAIYDETGCHYAEGRSLADDHYEQSRVTVTDESDPDVLALLDELEAIQKTSAERLVAIDTTHKMFQRERDRLMLLKNVALSYLRKLISTTCCDKTMGFRARWLILLIGRQRGLLSCQPATANFARQWLAFTTQSRPEVLTRRWRQF